MKTIALIAAGQPPFARKTRARALFQQQPLVQAAYAWAQEAGATIYFFTRQRGFIHPDAPLDPRIAEIKEDLGGWPVLVLNNLLLAEDGPLDVVVLAPGDYARPLLQVLQDPARLRGRQVVARAIPPEVYHTQQYRDAYQEVPAEVFDPTRPWQEQVSPRLLERLPPEELLREMLAAATPRIVSTLVDASPGELLTVRGLLGVKGPCKGENPSPHQFDKQFGPRMVNHRAAPPHPPTPPPEEESAVRKPIDPPSQEEMVEFARRQQHWTLETLGEHFGVSRATAQRWVAALGGPDELRRLAAAVAGDLAPSGGLEAAVAPALAEAPAPGAPTRDPDSPTVAAPELDPAAAPPPEPAPAGAPEPEPMPPADYGPWPVISLDPPDPSGEEQGSGDVIAPEATSGLSIIPGGSDSGSTPAQEEAAPVIQPSPAPPVPDQTLPPMTWRNDEIIAKAGQAEKLLAALRDLYQQECDLEVRVVPRSA